ncbi:hypothetical protein E4U42_004426 [Claviceps africana]|uniref:Uncharacterized protein n=1 Tax=Claviceps africana TaxID=83212 RepID=A0A8K0J5B1_9HYPO|nr:hypothetical protein E4U42_004426 [Claviceps africana]
MPHACVNHSNICPKWSRNTAPVLTVKSGSEITFHLRHGYNNLITPISLPSDLRGLDTNQKVPIFGPVAVEGAIPGHVLRVDILELTTAVCGWTAILLNSGLLKDEFPGPRLRIWDLIEGIRIPTLPFLGVMGVVPSHNAEPDTVPPYDFGGNMDCKHLAEGSSLYLPVQAEGALFSCGDGHAAQGDGKICGTAIGTPMKARLRFTLEKNKPWIKSPHYLTSSGVTKSYLRGQEYAAIGVDGHLLEATKKGVRGAIAWLVGEKGLTREVLPGGRFEDCRSSGPAQLCRRMFDSLEHFCEC